METRHFVSGVLILIFEFPGSQLDLRLALHLLETSHDNGVSNRNRMPLSTWFHTDGYSEPEYWRAISQ